MDGRDVVLRLARVSVDRLKELVTDAWRMRAPDSLVGDLDDGSDSLSPDLSRADQEAEVALPMPEAEPAEGCSTTVRASRSKIARPARSAADADTRATANASL
ncbi:hypothetical protein V6U89_20160 [Micromonospora sp. CPCC 206171]|uniref:hypothetical protein n=1 Tax=Micromonospora sp. CPCC 206171 TaxID=3122405 RepID=UPI002FF1FA25